MRLTRVTAPSGQPITRDAVKAYLEVQYADRDDLIDTLIDAVTDYLDGPSGILGRAILQQTWRLELTGWPDRIPLPIEPVASVAVSWLDADGEETTLDASSYQLVEAPSARPVIVWEDGITLPQLTGQMYPVRIAITAGAADADSVDPGLKTAMIMLAGHWFEHRSAVVPSSAAELPLSISALLSRFRRHL